MTHSSNKKRIAVVGAGPAGLSFTLCAANLLPHYEIVLLEAEEEYAKSGIGYTIQRPSIIALSSIVKDLYRFRKEICCATWDHIEVSVTAGNSKTFPMSTSFGSPRHVLINALRDRVRKTGVVVEYNCSVDKNTISELARDCALVVGADGKGSLVRETFWGDLSEHWTRPSSAAGWAVSNVPTDQMAVRFFPMSGRLAMVTEYPISAGQTCVILDMQRRAWHGNELHAVLGECQELREHLFRRSTDLQNFHVTRSDTHVCSPLFLKNVVLIGDAAVSTHYSLGAGLVVALYSALELATSLKDNSGTQRALQSYRQYALDNLVPLHFLADSRRQWVDVAAESWEFSTPDLVTKYVEMCRVPSAPVEYQLRAFVDDIMGALRR